MDDRHGSRPALQHDFPSRPYICISTGLLALVKKAPGHAQPHRLPPVPPTSNRTTRTSSESKRDHTLHRPHHGPASWQSTVHPMLTMSARSLLSKPGHRVRARARVTQAEPVEPASPKARGGHEHVDVQTPESQQGVQHGSRPPSADAYESQELDDTWSNSSSCDW